MQYVLPVYVETHPASHGNTTIFVRLLFEPRTHASAPTLETAMSKLVRNVRDRLRELGKRRRHDELARFAFCPDLIEEKETLYLQLRRRSAKVKLPFVRFFEFNRWIVFSPILPDAWFELDQPDNLRFRAEEVLSEYFRKREKDDDEDPQPEQFTLKGSAWLTEVEISQSLPSIRPSEEIDLRALLGQKVEMDGEDELFTVGRRLRDLYPDQLDRVIYYEEHVARLKSLLAKPDRRPVLLCGPSQVGKTALIQEVIYQRMQDQRVRSSQQQHVWLLSPQRLISGMSYVGQWESRLLAILKFAARRNHTLYFDDVLGLYQAGQSMNSILSIANVLKPYVERREVRMLAEITPDALRKFREKDRGFADLFDIVAIEEPNENQTIRILIETQRRLEVAHHRFFSLDVLPTVLDIQRRFQRTTAFPGKACAALGRLARTNQESVINKQDVYREFQTVSGLPLAMLDDEKTLTTDQVREELTDRLYGQAEAIEAGIDSISLVKARLNDPKRPIATMLLVGPTGVGKTQYAKEIAKYFFGSRDRLLRFDMNEFITADSVTRLIGNWNQPEGLLTSAVRRQPFAVVLLDEIEKAHADVHDMLLQVLGEGRLTDSLGRTTDFSNTIILLTSNLGTSRSAIGPGFDRTERQLKDLVGRSVEDYFRPEFVNRLDRTIIFNHLSKSQMGSVARTMIEDLLSRPGLKQRRHILSIDHDALDWLVDQGYDRAMGARAMRRSIDQLLTSKLSEHLAATPPENHVTLIDIQGSDRGITASAKSLNSRSTKPLVDPSKNVDGLLEQLQKLLPILSTRLEQCRPAHSLEAEGLTPELIEYYDLQESVKTYSQQAAVLEKASQTESDTSDVIPIVRSKAPVKALNLDYTHRVRTAVSSWAGELHAHREMHDFIDEGLWSENRSTSHLLIQLRELVLNGYWLLLRMAAKPDDLAQKATLEFLGPASVYVKKRFIQSYIDRLATALDAEATKIKDQKVYQLEGAMLTQVLPLECGWHLVTGTQLPTTGIELRIQFENEQPEANLPKMNDVEVREYRLNDDVVALPSSMELRSSLLGGISGALDITTAE